MEFKELDNSTDLAIHISRNITEQMQYCLRLEEIIQVENQHKEKLEVEVKNQQEMIEKAQVRLENHKRSFEGLQGVSQATLLHSTDEELKWNLEQERLNELDIQMKRTMEEKQNYYDNIMMELGDHLIDPAALKRAKDVERLKAEIQRLDGIVRERRKDVFSKQQEEKYHLNKLIVEVASLILMIRKEEKMLEDVKLEKRSVQKSLEALREKFEKVSREQEISKAAKALIKESTVQRREILKSDDVKKYSSLFARSTASSATASASTTRYSEASTRKTEKPGKYNFSRFQLCLKGSSSQSKSHHGASRPLSHQRATPGRPSPLARNLKSPVFAASRLHTRVSPSSPVIPRSWAALSGNFTKHWSPSSSGNILGKDKREENQSIVKETSCVTKCEKESETASSTKEQVLEQSLDGTSAQGTEVESEKENSLMGTIEEEERMDQMEIEDEEQFQSQELVPSQGFEVHQPEEFLQDKKSPHEVGRHYEKTSSGDTADHVEQLDRNLPKITDGAELEKAPSNSQDVDVSQKVLKGELQDDHNSCFSLNTKIRNVYEQSSQELELNKNNFKFSSLSSLVGCDNERLPQDANLNNQSNKSNELYSEETVTCSDNFVRNNVDPGNLGPPTSYSATILERAHVPVPAQEASKRNDSQKPIHSESTATSFPRKSINSESTGTSFSITSVNSKRKVTSLLSEPHTPSLEQVKNSNISQEHGVGLPAQKHQSPVLPESSKGSTYLSPLFSDSNCNVGLTQATLPAHSESKAMGFPFNLGNIEGNKTPDFDLNFGSSFKKQGSVANSALDLFASPHKSNTSESETINFSLFGSCSSQEHSLPRTQFSFNLSESDEPQPSQPFFSLFGGEDVYSSGTQNEGSQSKFCLF